MKYLSKIINVDGDNCTPWFTEGGPKIPDGKSRVNILAIGDVGGTVLLGLKLLGGEKIKTIGIYDLDPDILLRYEYEMNQTSYPFEQNKFPEVKIIEEKDLFDCDVFLFCASKATPDATSRSSDLRMSQYLANKPIVEHYAEVAGKNGFKGLFAVISDPVDPLCKAAMLGSSLKPYQIQGFGLGVMNSRAAYFAKKNEKYKSFLTEGRSFGPHGDDLVIADSIDNYDDIISKELTTLAVTANLKVREAGFKPYIAPAISSAVLQILLTISGSWHYSSNYLCEGDKGAFLGANNRIHNNRTEIENLLLPEKLFDRIEKAFINLRDL